MISSSAGFRPWRASISTNTRSSVRRPRDNRAPLGPGLDLVLRRFGEAVARHVDEIELSSRRREEVELLRAARRVRCARKPALSDERVDQARLADVRAAGEGDLRPVVGRQMIEIGEPRVNVPAPAEELRPVFDRPLASTRSWGPVRSRLRQAVRSTEEAATVTAASSCNAKATCLCFRPSRRTQLPMAAQVFS